MKELTLNSFKKEMNQSENAIENIKILTCKESPSKNLFNSYKKLVLIIGFIAAFLHVFPNPITHTISCINFVLLALQYTFQFFIKIRLSKI